jgi:uncharacterized membrane protein YqjE
MTQASGLFASVRTLVGTLLGMVHTRLELIANELEEERLWLIRLFFYGLLALFFFCLVIVMLTLLVVAVFWESHRLLAMGVVTLVHLGVAVWLARYVLCLAKARPRLFSASLAELSKDRASLEVAE